MTFSLRNRVTVQYLKFSKILVGLRSVIRSHELFKLREMLDLATVITVQ